MPNMYWPNEPNPLIINSDGTQSPNPYYQGPHPYKKTFDGKLIKDWKSSTASTKPRVPGGGINGSIAAALAGLIPIERLSNEAIRGLAVILGVETPFLDNKLFGKNDIRSIGSTDYNVATPEGAAGYRSALKNEDSGAKYGAAIKRSKEYFDKKGNERNNTGLKTAVEDANVSDAVGLSPEARRYYEMKDKTIPEFEGRKSQLAEWANNFQDLAQKNYDKRLQRGDEMARRADLGLTPETFTQAFKDDKMMSLIEREYTPASDYQVPDFDPSSTNLNTGDKQRPGNFEYDPNYVDFSRNNTVPKEVVSVMEQLGI